MATTPAFVHQGVKFLMIGSLLLAVAAWWFKDSLPPPDTLQEELFDEPKQVVVRKPAIDANVNGVDYRIVPRYSYDIRALVVSLHHSDSWWDYAHKEWNDHINLMDLCVVWGESARNGSYRGISFSNNQWECHWSTSSQEAWDAFKQSEVSNNHMVTADPQVAKALKKIRIGDQIRVNGYLVNYTTLRNGAPAGTRISSEVRTDTGPGACEVLYIENLEVIGTANRNWRLAYKVALGVLLASVLAWMLLPVRFNY